MARKTGQYYLNIAGVVFVCATFLEAARAQTIGQTNFPATNLPWSIESLTLTGTVTVAPPSGPQTVTLAELNQHIRAALQSKDYRTALEYATIGLTASPANVQLLVAKAFALTKLHRFPAAIAAHKDVLAVEPDNLNAMLGVAELLLITGQVGEYRTFMSEHRPQIDTVYDGALSKYFSVLESYWTGDKDQFRGVVAQSLQALPSGSGAILGDWEFAELLSVISQQPNSPKKGMLLTFIRVMTGEVGRDQALKAIGNL